MLTRILGYFTLPLLLLLSNSSGNSAAQPPLSSPSEETGVLEKMVVGNGQIAIDLDLNRLDGSAAEQSQLQALRFDVGANSFFTLLVANNNLRGPEQGSMALALRDPAILPATLAAPLSNLVIEKNPPGAPFELAIRNGKTGLAIFNIEGHSYDYDANTHSFKMTDGRLLMADEFASSLGRPSQARTVVGRISGVMSVYPIEVTKVVNGEARSAVLPPQPGRTHDEVPNFVNGPDVIVGDLPSMVQSGSSGTQVGLAVATTSCNNGNVELDWFALNNTDHPVIPQNLYRMSGGASNNDRFEQIGESWLKHAFTALQQTICGTCTAAANGTHLGVGCSDPYDTSLNGSQSGVGSRAWVNPFTGVFPGGTNANGQPTSRDHTGHTHNGSSHRCLVEQSDLNTTLNPGATYYAEAQYVTPHEFVWCQAHAGECNMYNNVSYRRFTVTGTTSFTFGASGSTVRMSPAINAWTGATINSIEPVPGTDGRAYVAYKVTNPSAGVWHYEYAVYNQNLDRGIQSFSVPLGGGVNLTNLGFHAPLNHPGFANDGTLGSAGYSNAAWSVSQTASDVSWNSETFAQNQNANAIRWGTMYNFRFDANVAPQTANATVGFFKTGTPITVAIQAPVLVGAPTPTPSPTVTPGTTPTPTPTPPVTTPTPTPPAPTPTPTPTPTATPHTPTPTPPVTTPTPTPTPPVTTPTPPVTTPTPTPPATTPTPTPVATATPHTPTPTPPVTTPTPPATTPTPTPPATTPTPTPGATVTPTPPGATPTPSSTPAQALNLSTRMRVQPGDNAGIGGFIITGSAPMHLLLRGIGPSLGQLGVPNALPDTVLELHGPGGFVTVVNDNWRDDPVQEAAILATGIAPTSDLESAIDTTLNPGAYTAVLRGKNNASGVALIELYDLSQAANAKLANISTRAFDSTGDNIVIAGFTLGGQNGGDKVVVRGIGPSLAALGVPNALADPELELRDSNGVLLMSDNNWQDDSGQAAELTAVGLAPSNPLESAISVMLPPGLYTGLLSGINGSTGIGLVEVYDLGTP